VPASEWVAWTRAVPASYVHCIVDGGQRPVIDVDRAREEHAAYRAALGRHGYEVILLAADEATPDCPFIEDMAVLYDDVAVITRSGAPSRRAEAEAVASALAAVGFQPAVVESPGTLDGGDVLDMGDTVYVGRSARTNDDGIRQLAAALRPGGVEVVPVPVRGALHLKSLVNRLDGETLLMVTGALDERLFSAAAVVPTAPGEAAAANVVDLADGTVLMPAGYPTTSATLRHRGHALVEMPLTQFELGDGGATCLSLRGRRP